MIEIHLKRAYESPSPDDGCRILVDRLWPRGIRKEAARIDFWIKEVAPSTALRKWFGHDPAKWEEFTKRYFAELDDRGAAVDEILSLALASRVHGRLTLVYGARDETYNNAVALKQYLERRAGRTCRKR